MYLYSFLAGLAILPLFLYIRFPYLIHDLRFFARSIRCGIQISKYKKKKPFFTILDCFLDKVKQHPDKPFIVFENSTYSYLDADKQSNKIARSLMEFSSLKEGDTVALFFGNEPMYVFLWLGLSKIGCKIALLNHSIRSKSLLHCFSCSGANALIAATELKGAVEEILPALREQNISVFILSEECNTLGIETLSDKISKASDKPLSPDLRSNVMLKSPALYIYTSGTTGLPKAAVITHERVWLASFLLGLVGVSSDDVLYVCLPLYHTSAFLMGLTGAIDRGMTVILRRKFSASQFWDDCRKYNVTVIQYIGEIMRYLCNTPKKVSDRDHKVRIAVGNGIRADTWSEFLHRFGDVQIRECYGATEGNVGFINYMGKVGAIGKDISFLRKITPYALIKYDTEREEPVRDSKGLCIEVPRGETGLFVGKITKLSPFIGYAKNNEQTEKKRLKDVFEKGDLYFNSGDLLKIDQDGFVYFQDRIGDTFRWKGENVATNEVTDILITVDCIEEANVYGVKVPGHEGRIGMAAVKLKDGHEFDGSDTYECVKTSLPIYARPRFIRIQNSLALTGTFKKIKAKLAEDGFNPATIHDPLYILDENKGYIPMTQEMYDSISSGRVRL
ncbi:very long-chain acyl-CoA synthetase-like isoform X1 [Anguilla anguilla]|uniref:very long-chain acyl-CoA synthetase-like isoform X1 n=1 Tax=Anguilla anguilla TaxID=7936 RepID=UPI0015AE32B0|nr:very long-chain acyl-CoA synthetase-like isoform X1 [Anguilla anguilla]